LVAIKVFKDISGTTLKNEADALLYLHCPVKHLNIVGIIDVKIDGIEEKEDGQ
jgi:hypothetical protein